MLTNFSYNVEATKEITDTVTGFIFKPGLLEIIVDGRSMVDSESGPVEVINLRTILSEYLPDRKIVETRSHQFPAVMLQGLIQGFDVVTPIINPLALDQFLRSFNLKIKTDDSGNKKSGDNKPESASL